MKKIPRTHPTPLFQHSSFETVYRKFALPLTKFLIKRMGGDQEAVEEVFSQTVIASWKGFQAFEHKSSYFTWICKIALNKMADYYRKEIHERSIIVAPTLEQLANIKDKNLLPEEKIVLDELTSSIRECLGLLPKEKRQLLYLRFWRRLSIKKMALIFNTSERSVEGKIYRAKQEMRELISLKHPDLAVTFVYQPKNQPSP